MHQMFAVISCNLTLPYALNAIFWSSALMEFSSAVLSFSIDHKFLIKLRPGLLPEQSNVLVFFFLRKSLIDFVR